MATNLKVNLKYIRNTILHNFIIFLIGGFLYYMVEILYRGYSYISMYILGGLCFLLIGLLNQHIFNWNMCLLGQMFISCHIITLLEYITGYILNIKLGLKIWDYTDTPYNIQGQVCLLYTIFWFYLSLPAILLDDKFRHWLFKEPIGKYNIF